MFYTQRKPKIRPKIENRYQNDRSRDECLIVSEWDAKYHLVKL